MKKKLLFPCLLLTAAMLLTGVFAFGASAAEVTMTDAAKTAPKAGDVVTIATPEELIAFSKYVSAGGVTEGITFRLVADIAFAAPTDGVTNLNPIGGTYNGAEEAQAFKGTFDGNGKTISNVYLMNKYCVNAGDKALTADKTGKNATASSQYVGIFAKLEGATVKNLIVSVGGVYRVANGGDFGVITPYAKDSTISGCTVMATEGAETFEVHAKSTGFGGIVGTAVNSVIDGCSANVKAETTTNAAGIVVTAKDTAIRNCVVGGTYTNKKAGKLGGVAALLEDASVVENCYSFAELQTSEKNTVLGGLVGEVGEKATVENCFAAAHVTSGANYIYGALVGINNGTVKHVFGLRDAATSESEAHANIGSGEGATSEIYAYQSQTVEEKTSFVIGDVVATNKLYPCTEGSCTEEKIDEECRVCNGQGKVEKVAYVFEPITDSAITSLDGALNAWIAEKKASSNIVYANWVVSGNTIVNCTHAKDTYKPYDGKAPTCVEPGHGDRVCATCGTILAADVEIPADPAAHASADGKVYTCAEYECVHCKKVIPAVDDHFIDTTKLCADQICARCHTEVKATAKHTRPEDFDVSKPCMQYQCTVCGSKAHDAEHDAPEVKYSCQESICKVCQTVVQEPTPHSAGLAANCERAQLCLNCGEVINPAKGHKWGEAPTCGKAQFCEDCGKENPDAPATGLHTGDKEAPTCTQGVYCTVCSRLMQGATGHKVDPDEEIDCGHGKSCTVCFTILESATGDHCIDWTTATVIRPATPERTGIVEGECEDCGRKFEAYTTYQITDGTGVLQIYGSDFAIFTGTTIHFTVDKVKNHESVAFAEGYLPLQASTITALDVLGDTIALPGNFTVKMILNKSAAKMPLDKLKVYKVTGTTATELEIVSCEDGFITFKASGAGTFVVAGEKETAFDKIGAVQPRQTASFDFVLESALVVDTLATVATEQVLVAAIANDQPKQTAALFNVSLEEKKSEA